MSQWEWWAFAGGRCRWLDPSVDLLHDTYSQRDSTTSRLNHSPAGVDKQAQHCCNALVDHQVLVSGPVSSQPRLKTNGPHFPRRLARLFSSCVNHFAPRLSLRLSHGQPSSIPLAPCSLPVLALPPPSPLSAACALQSAPSLALEIHEIRHSPTKSPTCCCLSLSHRPPPSTSSSNRLVATTSALPRVRFAPNSVTLTSHGGSLSAGLYVHMPICSARPLS